MAKPLIRRTVRLVFVKIEPKSRKSAASRSSLATGSTSATTLASTILATTLLERVCNLPRS